MPDTPIKYDEYLVLNGRELAARNSLPPGFPSLVLPSGRRQRLRLDERFKRLEEQFKIFRKGNRVLTTPEGESPEQVVVIEIYGDVDDFIKATDKIPGLNFQFDLDIDELPAIDGFYNERKKEEAHTVGGKLFLIVSNQNAIKEMITLWNKWKRSPRKDFTHGWSKWKYVFQRLKDIRVWSDKDRLEESGVVAYWREQIELEKEYINTEIELWFYSEEAKRTQVENLVKKAIESSGGEVLKSSVYTEIRYHGLIAKLPSTEISKYLDGDLDTLKELSPIMFFRPCGQALVLSEEGTPATEEIATTSLPTKEEKCLVLDGFPLENHQALRGRINVSDIFSLAALCPSQDRVHGTAVSYLVAHGESQTSTSPVPFKIVHTPVLVPRGTMCNRKNEFVPDELNILDVVHKAVKDALNQYPTIKVINFSIGILGRPFIQVISPLARMIDWLSWKHKVLFVISSGNCGDNITIDPTSWANKSASQKKDEILKSVIDNIRHRKILSPAESLNNLTVGALHSDNQTMSLRQGIVDPSYDGMISPISRFGPGIRRAIKPEIYFPGGRQVVREPMVATQDYVSIAAYQAPPGIRAASPTGMGNNSFSFQRGSSFSAALASHACLKVIDFLDKQRSQGKVIPKELDHLLARALLVNGADTVGFIQEIKDFYLRSASGQSFSTDLNFALSGYGSARPDLTLGSDDYRVTAIATSSVKHEKSVEFRFPIPDVLSAQLGLRRVTTTLAWASEINPRSQKYRASHLWTSLTGLPLIGCTRSGVLEKPGRRGTLEHCVYEGTNATAFNQNSEIRVVVNAREDGKKVTEAIPFALVVTMETAATTGIKLFTQVRERIQEQNRVQEQVRT